MKNSSLFSSLLLSLSVLLFACNNDNNDGINNPGSGDCTASWKVNGQSYSENNMALCVYLDKTLNLSSSASGGDFQLQIDPVTTTGTYVADPSNPDLNVIVLIRLDDGTRLGSADATVVVTELSDSKAKGTFSGSFFDIMDVNLTPNFVVTDGQFSSNF